MADSQGEPGGRAAAERRDVDVDRWADLDELGDHAAERTEERSAPRDEVGAQHDQAGDRRDQAGAQRDLAGDRRDLVGVQRDQAADQRDEAADERDRVADVRDQVADAREQTGGMPGVPIGERITAEAVRRSEVAQRGAAFDRKNASQDRGAAASDRDTALEDRGFGANERTHAKQDRRTAAADRRASAEERHAASLDGLTGVYNRTAGLMELEREIARARRIKQALVLAFLDVDHLKAINDSGGHPAGDRVLVEVAETVKLQVRPYDLIMRYGGDEFICAFPGLTATDVTRRLALVNAVLAEAPVQASITAGITTLRSHDTANDLIARADARLYRERQKAAAGSSSASH